jgi:hypothetical protein
MHPKRAGVFVDVVGRTAVIDDRYGVTCGVEGSQRWGQRGEPWHPGVGRGRILESANSLHEGDTKPTARSVHEIRQLVAVQKEVRKIPRVEGADFLG